MNITCPACSASIEIDSSRVPADGLSVRCSQCAHTFLYHPAQKAAQQSGAAPSPAAPLGANRLSAGADERDIRYFIKRPTGKIFGPFDSNAIRTMLDAGKLSTNAELSPDQKEWKGLSEVAAFADLVDDLAHRAAVPVRNQGIGGASPGGTMLGAWVDSTDEDSESDDGAELPGVGAPQLPRSADSASKKSEIGNLPKPASRPPGLPKPRAPRLPRPKSTDGSSSGDKKSGAQLPKPRGLDLPSLRAGLPKPKSESSGPPDLPAPAPNLPAKSAGLPRSKAEDDLPQTRAHDLPGATDPLPKASGADNLPESRTQEVESWTQSNDLFGDPDEDADLFEDSSQDGDLFGEPDEGADLFEDSSQDDDLFGEPDEGADLFADSSQGEDLFGAQQQASNDDDLFGAEDDANDLFDAPVDPEEDHHFTDSLSTRNIDFEADSADFDMGGAQSASGFGDQAHPNQHPDRPTDLGGGDSDDLFDAPGIDDANEDDDLFAAPGFAEQSEDLFEPDGLHLGESSSSMDAGDDFLSDDNNFTFLDEASQPAEDDLAGMSGEWGDDLMSDAPAMDAFDSGRHDDMGGWEDDDWDPGAEDSQTSNNPEFGAEMPASTGPASRQPASRGVSAQTSREEAADADKKRGTMAMLGIVLLAVVLLAGLGYGLYTAFFSTDTPPVKQAAAPKATPTSIDLATIQSDTYGDLRGFIDGARKGKIDDADKSKLLLAESLFLTRYDDADIRQNAEALANPLAEASEGWGALARGAFEAQNANADAARSYLEPLIGTGPEIDYYAQLMMGIGDTLAVQKQLDASAETPAKPTPAAPVEDSTEAPDSPEAAPTAKNDKEDAGNTNPQVPDTKPEVAKSALNDAAQRIASRASSALKAAQKIRPDAPAAIFWQARLRALSGQTDTAIKTWQSALKSSASHVASSVQLGQIYYLRGDLNNATQALQDINGQFEALASPNERASAMHLQGMVHAARQESDEAITALTTALTIDVDRSDTIQALAEQYMSAQKYQEALNFFTTNKKLGAKNPDVMLGIVRAYMGLENWDEATQQLQRGAKLFPDDARFPLYLGRLNRDRLAYFDAKKALKQALKIDPSLLSAHAALAQLIWITDKDLNASETHIKAVEAHPDKISASVGTEMAKYYQMSDQPERAEQRYVATLKRHPNYWPARLALARMYLDTGENEQALKLLERAKAEGIKDLRLSAYLADAYRQSRQFAKAVDQINLVIAENTDDPRYIFIRGRIYFDQGNYDTAREDFIKAYELDPRFHEAYFYLGRTAFAQQDFTKAMKIFRHVLDYKPNNGEFHYWMGQAYEAEKRLTSALDEYRKATVVDEEFGPQNPKLYVRRGELLSKLGYSNKGKEDIATALRIAPEMVEALVAMGASNYRDKLYDEAIENFESALKLDPELADVQYKLGMAMMYTNREIKGAEHLQLAVRYGYEDPDIFQTLGYLYKRMNRKTAAINAFKKYLTLVADKESVPAKTKREMIQQIEELGGHL